MTGYLNFNDAAPQREVGEVIPEGTLARVILSVIDGGVPGPEPKDGPILHAAKTSDVLQLRTEFTVSSGPYARRKFWPNFNISGGALDENGVSKGWNVSKSQIRAIIESAYNINPTDNSAVAQQRRQLAGFRQLHGMEFAVKIGVEAGSGQYKDKNVLRAVLTPDNKDYAVVMGLATTTPGGWTIQNQPAPAPVVGGAMAPMDTGAQQTGVARPAWLNG